MVKNLLHLYMSDHLIHKHVIHSLHMLMSIDIEHFFTVMMSADFLTENHFKVRFPYNILLKAESNKIRITKRVLVSFIFIRQRLFYNIQCINTCYTIYSICIITVFLSFTQKTIVFLCNF